MRLEARVLEGDQTTSVLVPLSTFVAFKAEHGKSVNDCIPRVSGEGPDAVVLSPGDDFADWEPWVAWHAMTKRKGETRGFDDWLDAVEWVGIYGAPDALDPSGGEGTQTPPSSPESLSAPDAGPSSSTSTKTSNKPSGSSSTEAEEAA